MVNTNMVRTVVGIIGNIVSFGLFASPAPTFYSIIKRGAVEEFSPNPYLTTLLNCLLWVFYGMPFVHPHSFLVVTINGVGIVMESIYIILYLRYSNKKQRMWVFKVLACELVFFAAAVVLTLVFAHGTKTRTLVVGILCVILNICMYGMPLDVMRLVIKTKSIEYLPVMLSITSFCNGLLWLAYALLRFDLFITISNGTGAVLGFIQLILIALYYKSTPKRGEKKPNEVQLSSAEGKISPV
ncbi:hypothetical protein GIB67_016083 [Kingdonia uniflora]|uniref:Bidirectional sugar transporter SWEET n=1 Tax=Kingdonia uniflora TaxID=39325 RepID=A0A7J7L240_9MAGN|nr:hypothetical protein GIB67_016083 [Kingdonia uniflora]